MLSKNIPALTGQHFMTKLLVRTSDKFCCDFCWCLPAPGRQCFSNASICITCSSLVCQIPPHLFISSLAQHLHHARLLHLSLSLLHSSLSASMLLLLQVSKTQMYWCGWGSSNWAAQMASDPWQPPMCASLGSFLYFFAGCFET